MTQRCMVVSLEMRTSRADPLHLAQCNLVLCPVVKLRGPAIRVVGNPLSGFQGAVRTDSLGNPSVQ